MKKGRMTSIPGLVLVCGTDSPPSSPKNPLPLLVVKTVQGDFISISEYE